MARDRFRIMATSKQRIALIAALRYFQSQGCPQVRELKATHPVSVSDIGDVLDLVETAPCGPITVLVDVDRQCVATDAASDIRAYAFDLDLRDRPRPSKRLLDETTLSGLPVLRAARVVQRLSRRLVEASLNADSPSQHIKEET